MLRKIAAVILFIGIFSSGFIFSLPLSAHPGNTAADGGHYCWTNCEYWGYEYGTRHFHGGGNGGSYLQRSNYGFTETFQAMNDGESHARNKDRQYIESHAYLDARAAGYSDGYDNQTEKQYFFSLDAKVCDEEIKFTTTPSDAYRKSFQKSYHDECDLIYRAKYEKSYPEGFKNGQEEYNQEQQRIANENIAQTWEFLGTLALFLLPVLFAGWAIREVLLK